MSDWNEISDQALIEAKSLGDDYFNVLAGQYLDALAIERIDVKAVVVTPGGRIGNDSAFSRSKTSNWVAKVGGLPHYIRIIAHGLMKHGDKTESEAIHMAVGIVENWASGKGKVSAKVRAAAAKAVAEFRAKATAARAKTATKRATSKKSWHHSDSEAIETKGESTMEYKEVGVKGLTIDDEDQGIVTAIVSVTGVIDKVNDNILPGAYEKTLHQRTPKGVWGHDWMTPVSKTLDIKELLPGDPALPETLDNGDPWPSNAGALKVQMQFNLDTDTGTRAFKNVKFYGNQQEWSIGYQVPTGGADIDTKAGVRNIHTLALYEFSPVLFGAMPLARTTDVKTAQSTYHKLTYGREDDGNYLSFETKRAFSDDKRQSLAKNGKAMKDGSFPIESEEDLKNAIHAVGRASDVPSAKKHVIKCAKAMGKTDLLPDDWDTKSIDDETIETKDVDVAPYDTESDTDDTDDTDFGTQPIQVGAEDLQLMLDLAQQLTLIVSRVTGAGGFDNSDDSDVDDGPDAMDEDDLNTKSEDDEMEYFEPVTYVKTAALMDDDTDADSGETEGPGSFQDIVDGLSDFSDDIGNYDDLSDLASEYDDAIDAGNIDEAMTLAQNFVDALQGSAENATDSDTQHALGQAAQSVATALQEATGSTGDDSDDEDGTDDSTDDGTDGETDGDESGSDGSDDSGDGSEPSNDGGGLVQKKDGSLTIDTKELRELQSMARFH